MSRRLSYGFLASVSLAIAASGIVPALAQEAAPPPAAEAPRCGGLLCDLGIFGRKPAPGAPSTALPCNDFFCRAFGGSREAEAAPPPMPATEPAPVAEKPMRHAHKKAHRAKAKTPDPAPAEAK